MAIFNKKSKVPKFEVLRVVDWDRDPVLEKEYNDLDWILYSLEQRQIPIEVNQKVEAILQDLNQSAAGLSNEKFSFRLQRAKSSLISILRKQLKLVPKNYYRNLGLVIGLAFLGLPASIILFSVGYNWLFDLLVLLLGLFLGLACGAQMDKKVERENRQMAFELS